MLRKHILHIINSPNAPVSILIEIIIILCTSRDLREFFFLYFPSSTALIDDAKGSGSNIRFKW